MFFSYFQQQWFTYRFSLRINVNKKGKYSRVSRDQEIVPKFDQENIVIFVGGEREETRIKQGNKWNVHATSMRLRFENRLYNRLSRSAFFPLCSALFNWLPLQPVSLQPIRASRKVPWSSLAISSLLWIYHNQVSTFCSFE